MNITIFIMLSRCSENKEHNLVWMCDLLLLFPSHLSAPKRKGSSLVTKLSASCTQLQLLAM